MLKKRHDDLAFPQITYVRGASGKLGPVLRGTRLRVQTIVIAAKKWGLSPKEIANEYDISEAQVNEVLAFYAAHRQELDASIAAEQIIEQNACRRYSLEELVEAIALENLHNEIDIAILNQLYKYVGVVPPCLPPRIGATTGGLPLQQLHNSFRIAIVDLLWGMKFGETIKSLLATPLYTSCKMRLFKRSYSSSRSHILADS